LSETLKVLIVDDERPARRDLTRILGKIEGFEKAGEAGDGLKAVEMIRTGAPDIVLLDIQMPGLDGFQVLGRLGETGDIPPVIFVTAYDQYAIRAFDVHAVDYILKPVDEDRLREALIRARGRVAGTIPRQDLDELLRSVGALTQRVPVRRGSGDVMVNVQEILYACVSDGEVSIVTDDLEGTSSRRSLDELQSELSAGMFMRVHRAYLANIYRIREIIPWENNSFRIRMGNDEGPVIPVSRANARELKRRLHL
jgi:two-component system LytT family response regulator